MIVMFSKTNVRLKTCTQEVAVAFSKMPALKGERPLRPSRLAFLRGHLANGTFVSPTWAVVVDKATGIHYRANGQHSSTVLAGLSETEYPADLLVTVEEYTSDDLVKDAFPIFDLFDHPSSSRSNIDVMNLHRVYYEDLNDVDAKLVLTLAGGIALYEKGLDTGIFLPARDRGAYLAQDDYRQFILWAAPFAKAVHGWMLHKPGIVAEMLSQRRLDAATAETFWQLVFTESHPDADHETRELSRTLKEWAAKPRVTQDRFRKETAKQWRRYRRLRVALPLEHDAHSVSPTSGPTRSSDSMTDSLTTAPETTESATMSAASGDQPASNQATA
jgi:hypothetical protein